LINDSFEQATAEDGQTLRGYVREAWSQALVAAGDAGDEVQKILGRVGDFVGMAPEEARRLTHDLAQKLRDDRGQLEQAVETAVRGAVQRFKLPLPGEIESLQRRLVDLEAAVEKMAKARGG
jgi:polyhydroxyalkanoate synthesis regulator phasin